MQFYAFLRVLRLLGVPGSVRAIENHLRYLAEISSMIGGKPPRETLRE
jgi:hypothetical protein